MGLRKPIVDKRTADEFLQQMTPEERKKFDEKCQKQLKQTHDPDIINILKTRPTSINFDVYGDMSEFMEDVRAGKYDTE